MKRAARRVGQVAAFRPTRLGFSALAHFPHSRRLFTMDGSVCQECLDL